jgi:hypothetical protein
MKRLDPEILTLQFKKLNTEILQTPKKEKREYWKRKNEEYRHELKSGFNLLRKWVPDIENLTRPDMLTKTANYIQELQKKIKELETSQTPREPHSSSSEPVKTFASTPMKKNTTMDAAVQTTSEAESESQESLLAEELPEFNSVEDVRRWLLSPEEEMEFLASPEKKLPKFNTVEDVRRWLLSPEEEMEFLASPEKKLPEFNTVEDERRYLEL